MAQVQYSWIRVKCSCGFVNYVLGEDNKENYFAKGYTFCRKCGKKIYIASCPRCRYGTAVPEKLYNKWEGSMRCDICDEFFPDPLNPPGIQYNKIYPYDQLPKEIQQKIPRYTSTQMALVFIVSYFLTQYLLRIYNRGNDKILFLMVLLLNVVTFMVLFRKYIK